MRIRSWRLRVPEKLVVVVLGALTVLVVVESCLRMVGWVYQRQAQADRRVAHRGKLTLLCLGDSYTFGMGAPRERSYPIQLEQQLNASGHGRSYVVVNRGEPAQNSTQLRRALPANLDSIQPDVVIVMTGLNNCWNLKGYSDWLHEARQQQSWRSTLDDGLHHVCVFRLCKLLYYNVLQRSQGESRFPWVTDQADRYPRARGEPGTERQQPRKVRPAEPRPPAGHRVDESADHGLPQAMRARATAVHGFARDAARLGRTAEATARLRQAIKLNPYCASYHIELADSFLRSGDQAGVIEVLTNALRFVRYNESVYAMLGDAHQARKDSRSAVRVLSQGVAALPDSVKLNQSLGLASMEIQDFAQARSAFLAAYRIAPTFDSAHQLGCLYLNQKDPKQAVECLEKAIELDPEEGYSRTLPFLLQAFQEHGLAQERREYLERLARSRPELVSAVSDFKDGQEKGEGFQAWVLDDYRAIVKLCRGRGVRVLFSTYPGAVHPLGPSDVDMVTEVARLCDVPLVDNIRVFNGLRDRDSYFVADGHCNEKGYAVMASNVARAVQALEEPSPPAR